MTPATALANGQCVEEHRRSDRVAVQLRGRYMLSDGREFECLTIDISPTGISVQGPQIGRHGERVVVYIQNLGRVEGLIARRAPGVFALDIRAPETKRDRLAERIGWIVSHMEGATSELREHERHELDPVRTIMRLEDGSEFPAELLEVSLTSARFNVDARPPIGAQVMLGQQSAVVSRHVEGGLVVAFDLEPDDRPRSA